MMISLSFLRVNQSSLFGHSHLGEYFDTYEQQKEVRTSSNEDLKFHRAEAPSATYYSTRSITTGLRDVNEA